METSSDDYKEAFDEVVRTSGFVGVTWSARTHMWHVQRWCKGVRIDGGYFDDEIEAARQSNRLVAEYLQRKGIEKSRHRFNLKGKKRKQM